MSKVGPTYKDNGLDATPLADSGIKNDWSNSIHLSIRCVL